MGAFPFSFVGQGWLQLAELALAFVLSAVVGLERELHQKSAGLRTYSLVGISAALFLLISKYGFMDVLATGRVVVDPSRVAAQIVSGIGFIGGGVIFMRRDVVRGLTTAASVWLTAALGMACGAGLPILAIATTVGYFLVMFVYPALVRRILPREQRATAGLRIGYLGRDGLVGDVLVVCTQMHFSIGQVEIERGHGGGDARDRARDLADLEGTEMSMAGESPVLLTMQVSGRRPIAELVARLSDVPGIVRVGSFERGDAFE